MTLSNIKQSIDFKPITLADRTFLLPYLQVISVPLCDYAFANLYGWREYYDTRWAILGDNTLVISFVNNRYHHPVYMLPHCALTESRIKAIEELKLFTANRGEPLIFFGVTPHCSESLEELFPREYAFIWEDMSIDYIYTREKLVGLKGKKLQAKRNHINKFNKLYPTATYESLDPNCIDEYLHFVDSWLEKDERADSGLLAENQMIHRLLEGMEVLDLLGGILRVEGKIVALTIASYINSEVVDVHIEKADTAFEGSYTKINNEFAKALPESVLYLNREEDLGIPGLRKAKESYYPDWKLEKGVAVLKREP